MRLAVVFSLPMVLLCCAHLARAAETPSTAPTSQPVASSQPAEMSYEKDVRPVLSEFCFGCHGPEKTKGDLNLAKPELAAKPMEAADVWSDVASALKGHEMPPKKRTPQPTDQQRNLVLAWIGTALGEKAGDCSQIATDRNQRFYHAHVTGRRLTRYEYNNTVRDLIGLDVRPGDVLPEDGSGGEGFDTDGDTLFMSAISVEKYLQAADSVLRVVLEPAGAPVPGAESEAEVQAARKRLLPEMPRTDLPPHEAARRDLERFASRAFRRPATPPEVERFLKLFDRSQSRGSSFESSMRLAMTSVLISPNFLFLVEPAPDESGVYRLGDVQLASRLSYFLWSSMPDDELMQLAQRNGLHDPDALRGQLRRMLGDPRARALGENFGREWLGITALGTTVRPDSGRFPEFDDDLVAAMRQEAVMLVDSVLREDHGLLDLLDCNYTFLNERLARHYGIPNITGSQMRRVELADCNRGGVLELGAVLTTTSYPLRTSPVLRGKWVLETVLGEKINPPPPNAGTLPQDDHQADGLTLRRRLEQHRVQADCASCHQRMDPIGFGLENFDAVGRWRAADSGGAIDSSGQLSSGEGFAGPAELRKILLNRKDQFRRNFCRKMLGYALGRGLDKWDDCVVQECVKTLSTHDDRAAALFETIVSSAPFQYRYARK